MGICRTSNISKVIFDKLLRHSDLPNNLYPELKSVVYKNIKYDENVRKTECSRYTIMKVDLPKWTENFVKIDDIVSKAKCIVDRSN